MASKDAASRIACRRLAIRWFAIEAFMSCFHWLCAVVSEAGRRFLAKPCEPSEQFPCGGLVGWSFSGMKQVLNFSLVASWLRLGFPLCEEDRLATTFV
jgi:hypothetical protein